MFNPRLSGLAFLTLILVSGCSGTYLPPIDRPTAEGAAIGTIAGSYLSAQLALGQGVGNGTPSTAPWIAAGAVAGGLAGAAIGHWLGERYGSSTSNEPSSGPYDLVNPRPHQFDLMVENLSGFTGPGSIVRVREFNREGTGLHFPQIGINSEQMPTVQLRYWFNQFDALEIRFRFFDATGSHFQSGPIFFNGATIRGGQTLNADSTEWFSGVFGLD